MAVPQLVSTAARQETAGGVTYHIEGELVPVPPGGLGGYGNVFEVTLAHGESLDIEPGGWLHKDPTVRMETIIQRVTAGFLAGSGQLFWNRFTGPGRVGLQSMYMHFPTKE